MATFAKQFKACKYCGKSGLVWAKINGRFILAEPHAGTMQPNTDKLHTCVGQQAQQTAATTGTLGAQPTDQVRLTCSGCGTSILMKRADLVSVGAPICPKDETFYLEGLSMEVANV